MQNRKDFSQPLEKCWRLDDPNLNSLASDNHLIISLSNDGIISSIDLKEPIKLWKVSIGSRSNIYIRIIEGKIFVINNEHNTAEKGSTLIREIDGQSGLAKKVEKIKESSILNGDQFLTSHNLQIRLLLGTDPGSETKTKLTSIDITSLQQIQIDKDLFGKSLLTAQSDSTSFIVDGNIILENRLSDGLRIRSIDSKTENTTAVLSFKKELIWGDQKGNVFILNQKSDSPNRILRTGGKISSIQSLGNNILVVSDDNFLYLYSPESKKVIWKKRLPGRVNISPVNYSKTLFVTTTGEPKVYLIDIENGQFFNQILTDESEFIKDVRVNNAGIFVLTNLGIIKYSEDCGK